MPSFLWDHLQRYPIHIVLGEPGSGKSLFGTYMAWLADQEGIQTFTNFHVFGFQHNHYIRYYKEYKDGKGKSFEMVNDLVAGKAEDGTPIKNGLIVWDEPQSTGLDKHSFWSEETQELNRMISQIRKDDLGLLLITQILDRVAYDARTMVSFVYEIHPTPIAKGVIDVWRFDFALDQYFGAPIRIDLRPWFPYYNTKERMGEKPDDGKEKETDSTAKAETTEPSSV